MVKVVKTFWRTSVLTTSVQSGTIPMLTGLEHIIWITQPLTGARWSKWYQYFLASLSGIMNMCIPKNTLPHCYNLPWLNKHSCSHWEELTCASRWKSREIMQMFVKYTSTCGIKWSYSFAKPKWPFMETKIPETLKRFGRLWNTWNNTRVHCDTTAQCDVDKAEFFLCYLLQLSPVCSNSR